MDTQEKRLINSKEVWKVYVGVIATTVILLIVYFCWCTRTSSRRRHGTNRSTPPNIGTIYYISAYDPPSGASTNGYNAAVYRYDQLSY